MAWIEVHQSIRDHRKVLSLAALLDMEEPHVVGHLIYLWEWSLDNAQDGLLPNSERIIARAAAWRGEASAFVNALINAGFIDKNESDGSLWVHDWMDYAGRLVEKREKDAQRKRIERSKQQSDSKIPPLNNVQRTSNGHPRDGAGTVPNLTVPNHISMSEHADEKSDDSQQGETNDASASCVDAPEVPDVATSKKTKIFDEETEEYRLACYLRSKILERKPDAKVPKLSPSAMSSWCKHIDYMIRIDHRASDDIKRVIDICQSDSFWQRNILSTEKLREKFDRFTEKTNQEKREQSQQAPSANKSKYRIFV